VPGIDDVSPDWKPATTGVVRAFGPQQFNSSSGVLSADHGRPPTKVQGRPCHLCGY
jgi:hypothetical protein